MTTKTYALLDPHANGPFEEIEDGGLVLSCNTDGADIHRMTRATEGFSSGLHYFEGAFYGEGDLPGLVSIGIVTAAHPLSMFVGEDTSGYGYLAGDGDVVNGGGSPSAASCDSTNKKIVIGVLLDADANECTWFVANSPIATVSITPGQTWYPAVTVGSTIAFDLSCFVQFGDDAFTYPQPGDPGWFTESTGFGELFLCDKTGYLTTPTDTPANRPYEPRILDSDKFTISRHVAVWPWANQNSGSTVSALSIDNHDGRFDFLLPANVRNARCTVRLVPTYAPYTESFVVGTALIDQISTDGEAKLKISLQDTMVQLQRPLQTRKFPPYVDKGTAGRPLPITLGACRQVQPVLIDQEVAGGLYQVHDQPITNIAVLRDKGDALDPNATPPDYVITADVAGFQLQAPPQGVLTGDFSSVGQQFIIPGAADVLAGDGLFTAWPSPIGNPTGWTSGGSGTVRRLGTPTAPQNYVAVLLTTDPWNPGAHVGEYLKSSTAVLKAGRTYNLTFKLFQASGSIPFFTGGLYFGLRVLSALDNLATSSITPYNQPLRQPFWRGDSSYAFQYTVPAGADRFLYFSVAASTGTTSSSSSGGAFVSFYGIRLEELPQSAPDIPVQGITLFDLYTQIIETRAKLTSADWVGADATAIDTATGYTYGYHVDTPVKIEESLRVPADSSCSAVFTDHLGRIRVRQLRDPATADDGEIVLDISDASAAYPVNASVDRADGLTTTAGSRLNYYVGSATDWVTDYSPITGIDAALRWQFQRQSQFLSTSTAPLADFYQFAKLADPLYTLMDDPDQAQVEINRVNAFYSETPRFYTMLVLFDTINAQALAQLIFGDIVRVTYKPVMPGFPEGLVRYGLDAKKLFVVDTVLSPADNSIELTLWG